MARPNPRPLDMIRALAVLIVPVLLAWAWFSRVPDSPPIEAQDYQAVAAAVRPQAPYALAVPSNLPTGWTCTRARWTAVGQKGVDGQAVPGNTWQLGFLTPEQTYLAIDQRDAEPDSLIKAITRGGHADGRSRLTGRDWERWLSPDGRTRALVLREGTVVTLISGDTSYAELEAFAGTLA